MDNTHEGESGKTKELEFGTKEANWKSKAEIQIRYRTRRVVGQGMRQMS